MRECVLKQRKKENWKNKYDPPEILAENKWQLPQVLADSINKNYLLVSVF